MRKKIAGTFFLWLMMAVILGISLFFTNEGIFLGLLLTWILLPCITWICNIFAAGKLSVSLETRTGISKREENAGKLLVMNECFWPVMKVYCKIAVKNRLTGEKETIDLALCAVPKEKTECRFLMSSEHCGYLDLWIEEFWLMDWIGFLPWKTKKEAKVHTAVLPDTFVSNVYLQMSAEKKEDAQNWSAVKKGNDQSELFALRDYVPGDSLRKIHWKLSVKKNQMIVKEASLPVEKSLLIFWDKNVGEANAEEMDAMAESIASIGQSILSRGIPFLLGWTEEDKVIFETIDFEEQLLQAIPRMIKYGAYPWKSNENEKIPGEYGKVLIFSAQIPQKERFLCEDIVVFLCRKDLCSQEPGVVSYGSDTYMTDLEYVEI